MLKHVHVHACIFLVLVMFITIAIAYNPCTCFVGSILFEKLPLHIFWYTDLHKRLVNLSCSSPDLNQTEAATTVPFGEILTVSCTATFPNEISMTDGYPLWLDNNGVPLTKGYKGVKNISLLEQSENSISSVLQVQASVISGAKWPEQLTHVAKVVLPGGGEFTWESKPYIINIVGELRLTFHHADEFVLSLHVHACTRRMCAHNCIGACACVDTCTHIYIHMYLWDG